MPHILVIDGHPDAAQVTTAGIAHQLPAVTVSLARDVAEARSHLRERAPDVVLIDPAPYSSAVALLVRDVRANYPAAFILVLASAAAPSLWKVLLKVEIDSCLAKPVTLAILIARIRRALTDRDQRAAEEQT